MVSFAEKLSNKTECISYVNRAIQSRIPLICYNKNFLFMSYWSPMKRGLFCQRFCGVARNFACALFRFYNNCTCLSGLTNAIRTNKSSTYFVRTLFAWVMLYLLAELSKSDFPSWGSVDSDQRRSWQTNCVNLCHVHRLACISFSTLTWYCVTLTWLHIWKSCFYSDLVHSQRKYNKWP